MNILKYPNNDRTPIKVGLLTKKIEAADKNDINKYLKRIGILKSLLKTVNIIIIKEKMKAPGWVSLGKFENFTYGKKIRKIKIIPINLKL